MTHSSIRAALENELRAVRPDWPKRVDSDVRALNLVQLVNP
jgi:hypothetical protein